MSRLGRRAVLQGLASAAVLAPMLRSAAAFGQSSSAPKRFVLWMMSNGLEAARYRGAGLPARLTTGQNVPISLGASLAPLAPHLADVMLVEGLYNPFSIDLHGNQFATTTCVEGPPGDAQVPGGISIDRFIAKSLSTGRPRQSVNLATVWHPFQATHRSADGLRAPFPAEGNPRAAFNSLFGALAGSGDAAARARAQRREKKVVDFIRADAQRIRARVGGIEAQKLEQYLESLSELERKVDAAPAGPDCTALGAPAPDEHAPEGTVSDELIEAQVGNGLNALICGLTQVVSIAFGTSEGGISHCGYSKLTHPSSHHVYCHANDVPAQVEIQSYLFGKVADFWKRLKAVPEGNGTMADNTLMLVVNDGGGTHHNGGSDFAQVVIAGSGIPLKRGRFISLPARQQANDGSYHPDTCASDLYCALAQSLGVAAPRFGDPSVCKGPLAAVML
jgi:hypothetical protein